MKEPSQQESPGEVTFDVSRKPQDLKLELKSLRKERKAVQKQALKKRRRALSPQERTAILSKTGGRCHICGGTIEPERYWEADHVLRHCAGGGGELENYLATHGLCNTYRWDHLPKEVQWILKIGVWARKQMESESDLGRLILDGFFKYERGRESRKKPQTAPSSMIASPIATGEPES
jgi:hypothetical protein